MSLTTQAYGNELFHAGFDGVNLSQVKSGTYNGSTLSGNYGINILTYSSVVKNGEQQTTKNSTLSPSELDFYQNIDTSGSSSISSAKYDIGSVNFSNKTDLSTLTSVLSYSGLSSTETLKSEETLTALFGFSGSSFIDAKTTETLSNYISASSILFNDSLGDSLNPEYKTASLSTSSFFLQDSLQTELITASLSGSTLRLQDSLSTSVADLTLSSSDLLFHNINNNTHDELSSSISYQELTFNQNLGSPPPNGNKHLGMSAYGIFVKDSVDGATLDGIGLNVGTDSLFSYFAKGAALLADTLSFPNTGPYGNALEAVIPGAVLSDGSTSSISYIYLQSPYTLYSENTLMGAEGSDTLIDANHIQGYRYIYMPIPVSSDNFPRSANWVEMDVCNNGNASKRMFFASEEYKLGHIYQDQ